MLDVITSQIVVNSAQIRIKFTKRVQFDDLFLFFLLKAYLLEFARTTNTMTFYEKSTTSAAAFMIVIFKSELP